MKVTTRAGLVLIDAACAGTGTIEVRSDQLGDAQIPCGQTQTARNGLRIDQPGVAQISVVASPMTSWALRVLE